MLVSAIHQHESAIGVCMSPPSLTFFPPPAPDIFDDIEIGSFAVIPQPINDHSIQEYVRISLSLGLDPFHISEGPDNQQML